MVKLFDFRKKRMDLDRLLAFTLNVWKIGIVMIMQDAVSSSLSLFLFTHSDFLVVAKNIL